MHSRRPVKAVALLLVGTLLAPPLLADGEEPRDGPVCAAAAVSESSEIAADFPEDLQAGPREAPAPPAPQTRSELSSQETLPQEPPPQEPAPPKEPPPTRPSLKPKDFWKDIKVEAKRYVADSYAIVTAPLHWDGADWTRFGGVVLLVGGLMLADENIDREAQQNRSRFTDRVSDATTGFGGGYGPNVGVAYLLAGYAFRNWDTRETGREILEAGLLTHLLGKWILKPAFGRERPFESDGETHFHFGSSHDSFPSGHATEAFSVASVIAIRSKGWVIPTIAYTAATLVAFDRVNDHVHFASDVAAGAVLGTAVGRFIVNRHKQAQGQKPAADINLVPIRGGLAARVVF